MLENSAGRVVLCTNEPKLADLMVVGGVKRGRNRGRGTAVAFVWMLRARIVSEYPALQKGNGGKRAACPAKNRTRAAREVLKLYQHIGSLFSRGLSHTPDGPRSFGGKICLWAMAGLPGMIREWPL